MKKILFLCGLSAVLCVSTCTVMVSAGGFTPEEKQYIEQKKSLRVAVLDDWRPILAKDGDTGFYQGLAADVLANLSKKTGLKIEYVEAADYLDAMEMTEHGEADVFPAVIGYEGSENTFGIEMTEPYLTAQMMMIYNKSTALDKLKSFNVAEVEGYPVFSDNARIEALRFDTPEDCLIAVRSGHADIMYCDTFTGTGYMQKYQNRELLSFPINTETTFRIGISGKENRALKMLLNEVIAGMDRREINDSLTHNRRNAEGQFDDFVYRHPFEIICVCMTGAFLIVVAFNSYYGIKSRQRIALQGYMESYCLLADTFGEAGFDYDCAEDKMTVFGKHAYKLSMPSVIENFSAYLEQEKKEISLTKEQFEKMLGDGVSGESYETELKCRLKDGDWQHFSLFFSVIATDESYKRPVRMVGCLNNVEQNYKEKEHLRYMGMYDRLTGLHNRTGMEWKMRERAKQGENTENDVLLLIDVDNFKSFNDEYGHRCGDDVLRYTGTLLRKTFRQDDVLCRWGGDEFLLYLIGAAGHIELIEHRCRVLQSKLLAYKYEGISIHVTLSIGGAAVGDKSFEEVFKEADNALYKVKENGRDAVYIPHN